MARILYVSQYFVSDDQPGGVRHWRHCRALVEAGHDVTVVTSYVQHKERTVADRYQGRKIVREQEGGMEVFRTYSTPGYGRDLRSRLASYGSFAGWAFLAALRAKSPDVVVASSPPLPAAGAALAVAEARRARFVLEVRDLWPDSVVAMGLVKDPRVIGAARRLERTCYSRADRVIALTEGIRDGVLEAGVNPAKVALITNGVDLDVVEAAAAEAAIGAAPAVALPVPEDAVVAMYVGAHGTYSSLGTVLEAADRLRDRQDLRFVLIGGGDQKPALVAQAEALKLPNVAFVDSVPKRAVPSVLARADICLLPYQDRQLFAGALPNKTFDYLGAARPIVAAVPPGELSGLIERARCGVAVPAEDPAALAEAVATLADDPDGRARMGAAGAEFVRAHYDRRLLAARFVELVESLV